MNFLAKLYEKAAYRIEKWMLKQKYKKFLKPREFSAVFQYYEAIYREN